MENVIILVTNGGGIAWPDRSNMSSDDGSWEGLTLPSLSPTESAWKAQVSSPSFATGQLSPVGSNIDILVAGSSAPDMTNSAPSSCADGWSTGCGERDDVEDDSQWDPWELSSDEALVVPKLEPADDHINLDELKAAPLTPIRSNEAASACEIKPKRPRGRPRKHPLGPVVNAAKVTKGRSKTGCITCRKRKKKCDEAKPICMNCEKNAVVCEGYHEKQVWKSGKERAEEERMICESFPAITMQPIFNGVETEEDKTLWKHYVNHFSNVLTVEGEAKNAFKDIILQLANRHQGLMHSILAVSSRHMDLGALHGAKILQNKEGTSKEALHRRGEYHHDEALRRLYEDMAKPLNKDDPEHQTVLAARYGQMLCLLLQTRADGNPRGEHRVHLQAYKKLIEHSPPEDERLRTFITEFFQYHIYADDLLWHPETLTERLSSEDWEASEDIQTPRLLGVADGLFRHLSQITTIRNTIRSNMAASVDPLVDYTSLYKAAEIETAIREWTPRWPRGDSRGRLALLYKQTMWVYLFRTIYPPSPSPSSSYSSSSTPVRRSTLASLPPRPPTASQPRRASMTATTTGDSSAPNLARNSSMHDDVRITLAVDESLDILESFKPCDPAQTLLLIPCLLLGTSCFSPAQQQRVRAAVGTVRAYTGLKSCDRTLQLLDEVWRLMHSGDWVSVWDWQGVASRMGLDFLCA